jgi:hypothetical protein
MRKLILFSALFSGAALFAAGQPVKSLSGQPGGVLSGIVRDSAGGKPLAGVSVFLNNTSRGTVTRSDGSFLLPNIPKGAYELIISAIGYQTTVIGIDGGHFRVS